MYFILLAGIFILLYIQSFSEMGLRRSIIQAYLLLIAFVALSTELLSIFDLITRTAVILVWGVIGLVFLVLLMIRILKKRIHLKDLLPWQMHEGKEQLAKLDILIILSIGVILIFTLVIALAAPPNNFDSMTYHMARVSNWIQNQNISYYPTAIDRQNYFAPLAEFLILQLQLISQSDYYANLVQWSAFVILILLASEIAAELKVSRRGQLIAALFSATIPMAILQSTGTQNDLFAGVGCLGFAYFLLRSVRESSWQDGFFAGIAMGSALMTKGTGYIYCAAVGIPLGLYGLFIIGRKKVLKVSMILALVILIGLVMNLGVYQRNWDQYSHPLSTETNRLRNEVLSVEGLTLNLARNGLVQLAVPFQGVNQITTNMVDTIFGSLNEDPRFIFGKYSYQVMFAIDEDLGSNLPHFVIILIALVYYLLLEKGDQKETGWLFTALILSAVLFSLTIKWQSWGSRLQLPVFLLAAPFIGYLVDRKWTSIRLIRVIVTILSLYSIPYLLLNSSRPLVPIFPDKNPLRMDRVISNSPLLYDLFSDIVQPYYANTFVLNTPRLEQYFTSNLRIYPDYLLILDYVNELDLDVVGLEQTANSWEYPIWVYLDRHAGVGQPEIIQVGEGIGSQRSMDYPEYIITTKGENSYFLENLKYHPVLDTKYIDILRR